MGDNRDPLHNPGGKGGAFPKIGEKKPCNRGPTRGGNPPNSRGRPKKEVKEE